MSSSESQSRSVSSTMTSSASSSCVDASVAAAPPADLSVPSPPLPSGPSAIAPVAPISNTPFSGPRRHCAFVMLAEFDILKGSQLKYQYPRPTKIKENLLAESMLPEGAHLRESDWTVSFLSNDMMIAADAELRASRAKALEKALKDGSQPPSSDGFVESVELQDDGYLCMLNLVRTKMDRTVARGAVVKALAIATPHRYYNIFKPLLMLTLDQYFEAVHAADREQLLVNLYHTINNMNLHEMPTLTPLQQRLARATRLRTVANPSANDYFNTSVTWAALPAAATATSPPHTGTGTSTGTNTPKSNSPTATLTGALASVSISAPAAVLPMRIPLSMEPDEVLEASLQTLVGRFQERVLAIYTALLAEKRVLFLGYQQPASLACECVLSACMLVSPPLVGTIRRAFPYANLVNMDFLNVPGYIAGVTNPIFETRSGWWDLLCNISNGEVTFSPAYAEEMAAAATTAHHAPPTGAPGPPAQNPLSSSGGASLDVSPRLSQLDYAFFVDLNGGVRLRFGEEWARCMFRDLTHHFLLLVDDRESFVGDEAGAVRAAHLVTNAYRIRAFQASGQCAAWRARQERFEASDSAFGDADSTIRRHVRTLQMLSSGSNPTAGKRAQHTVATANTSVGAPPAGGANGGAEAAAAAVSASAAASAGAGASAGVSSSGTSIEQIVSIYASLVCHVRTRDEILEFLAMLPESRGGLFPIAVGLLHRESRVRHATIGLLQRIDAQPEGSKCVSAINYFLLMTYYRFSKQSATHANATTRTHENGYSSSDDDETVEDLHRLGPSLFMSPSSAYGPSRLDLAMSPSSVLPSRAAATPAGVASSAPGSPSHDAARVVSFETPPGTARPISRAASRHGSRARLWADDDSDEESDDVELDDLDLDQRVRAPTFHGDDEAREDSR